MAIHFNNEFNNHNLNQEEFFELISDLIPGFNHKLSNFLMKITGQATLLQRHSQYSEIEHSHWDLSLPELCDQFSLLMNKLLTLVRSADKGSSRCAVIDGLVVSLSRFQQKKPQRPISFDNHLTEKDYIWSDFMRLQRCIYYLLLGLDSCCLSPTTTIQIRAAGSMTLPSSAAYIPKKPIHYIEIEMSILDWRDDVLNIRTDDLYAPDKPLTFPCCCLAAAETILQNHYGHLVVQQSDRLQITVHIPQLHVDHSTEDDAQGEEIFFQRQALAHHHEWLKTSSIKSD